VNVLTEWLDPEDEYLEAHAKKACPSCGNPIERMEFVCEDCWEEE
jgi:hypothetical protein